MFCVKVDVLLDTHVDVPPSPDSKIEREIVKDKHVPP